MRDEDTDRLVTYYLAIPAAQRQSLLDYAAYLADKAGQALPAVAMTPVAIPRPAQESVVSAIRRLSMTYPMLEKKALLHEASALMAEHVLHGRVATDVIDELEELFKQRYERHCTGDSVGRDTL